MARDSGPHRKNRQPASRRHRAGARNGSRRSGLIQRTHEASKPLKVARHQRMGLAQLVHEKVQAIPVIFQFEVVALEVAELEQLQERGEGSLRYRRHPARP